MGRFLRVLAASQVDGANATKAAIRIDAVERVIYIEDMMTQIHLGSGRILYVAESIEDTVLALENGRWMGRTLDRIKAASDGASERGRS